jgi:hypothetical protein
MDLSVLMQYIDVLIVGICLCVGFIIKKWIKDVDNKFIPTIVAALGLILKVVSNFSGGITLELIFSGLFSGLASTGLHQAFTQLIGTKEEK